MLQIHQDKEPRSRNLLQTQSGPKWSPCLQACLPRRRCPWRCPLFLDTQSGRATRQHCSGWSGRPDLSIKTRQILRNGRPEQLTALEKKWLAAAAAHLNFRDLTTDVFISDRDPQACTAGSCQGHGQGQNGENALHICNTIFQHFAMRWLQASCERLWQRTACVKQWGDQSK